MKYSINIPDEYINLPHSSLITWICLALALLSLILFVLLLKNKTQRSVPLISLQKASKTKSKSRTRKNKKKKKELEIKRLPFSVELQYVPLVNTTPSVPPFRSISTFRSRTRGCNIHNTLENPCRICSKPRTRQYICQTCNRLGPCCHSIGAPRRLRHPCRTCPVPECVHYKCSPTAPASEGSPRSKVTLLATD